VLFWRVVFRRAFRASAQAVYGVPEIKMELEIRNTSGRCRKRLPQKVSLSDSDGSSQEPAIQLPSQVVGLSCVAEKGWEVKGRKGKSRIMRAGMQL
jgi:hypothetical protein